MDNRNLKKGAAAALAAALVFGTLPTQVRASDISGHWAEETMKQWVAEGLLKGDGQNYRPNDAVTRAQFMAFTNRALKLTGKASVEQFEDIQPTDWFYEDVAKAVQAGYTNGTSASTMSPQANITNQQMYAMLGRLAQEDGTADLSVIKDLDSVADWALEDLEDAIANGYVVGNRGKVNPDKLATRAQAITILDRLKNDSRCFALPGVYTVDAKEVTVMDDGIILRDCTIAGDLILQKNVKSVRLDNVTVGGRIIRENENTRIIEAAGEWQDGTYEGVAMGNRGPIRVTVTVKDGRITKASVLEHREDTTGEIMMDTVMRQINKTGDIRNITFGNDQTINSEGVLNAVKDALSQASGSTLKPGQSKEAQKYTVMKDGTYVGEANGYGGRLSVQMVVKNNQIAELKVLKHRETASYMPLCLKVLTRITENGGTEGVDTISGATSTSQALIRASEDAIAQALGKTKAPGETPESILGSSHSGGSSGDRPEGQDFGDRLEDGTYYGTATGYRPGIKVTVVVENKKIASVEVTDHDETLSYYRMAEVMPQRIVEANSTKVDTVSGATATSRGILSAVEDALAAFMKETSYADGVWYGQGRGMYSEDAIDNRNHLIRNSRIEAKVTVQDGRITGAEMSYFGDDESHKKQEAYDYISNRVVAKQGTDGLYELLNLVDEKNPDKNPNVDGFDAITGATRSTRGYVSAIEDALHRSEKFEEDGIPQKVRSLRLVNPPEVRQFKYGESFDMSAFIIHVEYLDGTSEDVPFNELKSHGITVSLENPIQFAPADPTDYSQTRKYIMEFRDTVSTAKHATSVQANRAAKIIDIASIELTTDNGETVTISCDGENFLYDTPKLEKHLKGVQKENIKVTRADGQLAKVKDVRIQPGYSPVITIDLENPVTPNDAPLYQRYRFATYKLSVKSDARFDPTALSSYHVVSNPSKLIYSEGETLDLTGLRFSGTDDNYLQGEFSADKLIEYGFTITPALDKKLTAEDTQLVISKPGLESTTFPLTVVKQSTADPMKIELYDSTGNMKLAVMDLSEFTDPQAPDKLDWPVNLPRVTIPTGYKGLENDLIFKALDAEGNNVAIASAVFKFGTMKLSFSSNPEEMKYIMFGFKYEEMILPMECDVPHTIDVIGKDGETVLHRYDLSAYKKPDNINELKEWPLTLSSERAVVPTEYQGHLNLLTFKAYDATGRVIPTMVPVLMTNMVQLNFSSNPEDQKYVMFGFKYEDPKPAPSNVPHTIEVRSPDGQTVYHTYDLSDYKNPDNINEMQEWPITLTRAQVPDTYKDNISELKYISYDAAGNVIESAILAPSGKIMQIYYSDNPEEMKYIMFGFKFVESPKPDVIPDGDYPGVGTGYAGQIKVVVTMKDNAIAKVKVTEHSESREYFVAAETVLEDIVAKNGTKGVDAVSGATTTCYGIFDAVNNALSQYHPEEEMKLADGTWYGQGRGNAPYDHAPTFEGAGQDGGTAIVGEWKTATEVSVEIADGRITDVKLEFNGDDGNEVNGFNATKGFPVIRDYILSHQTTDGLMEIFAEKQKVTDNPGDPGMPPLFPPTPPYVPELNEEQKIIFDAVTSATNTSRGIVHAVDDALNRSAKYQKDGIDQEVRSIVLNKEFQQDNSLLYGQPVDLSAYKVTITYLDGRKEEVPFNELAEHGITCSLGMDGEFVPEPINASDYSKNRNYDLIFTHANSTAKHVTRKQASRQVNKIAHSKITFLLNGEPQTIELNTEEYTYNLLLGDTRISTLENIIVYDMDGQPCELQKAMIYGADSEAPYLQINLVKLKKDKSQPVVSEYLYNTYNINLMVDEEIRYPKVTGFTVDSTDMKKEYQVGDALDYTGLKFVLTLSDGTTATVPFASAAIFDNVDAYTMENGDLLDTAGDVKLQFYCYSFDMQDITIHVTEPAAPTESSDASEEPVTE